MLAISRDFNIWTTQTSIVSVTGDVLRTAAADAVTASYKYIHANVNVGDIVEFNCYARKITGEGKIGIVYYNDATIVSTGYESLDSEDWKLYRVVRYIPNGVNNIRLVVGQFTPDIGESEYHSPELVFIKRSNTSKIIRPTLLNSWEDYYAQCPLQIYKDVNGIVHISGVIKSGACPSVVCDIPVELRSIMPVHAPVVIRPSAGTADIIEVFCGSTLEIKTTVASAPSFVAFNISYVGN